MSFRIFGIWCLLFGHRRDAASRRSENGSIFGTCATCGREMYREPVRGKWRLATETDRQRRGFDLTEARPDVVVPKKRPSRARRR